MVSFYPGPSQVYEQVPAYVKDAFEAGVLGMNHRSPNCMALVKETVSLLKNRLSIPDEYALYFTSSATECWEIIAQSLASTGSTHVYSGAFGQKWFDYTNRLTNQASSHPFDREEPLPTSSLKPKNSDVVCVTQNETSNGTQVDLSVLTQLRQAFPKNLIAIDATSSMAGIELDFTLGDIWFASVQKCFGLPAGLGVLVCSPNARKRFLQLNERNHYNSILFMDEMMEKWQTPYTPNVLAIYLLMRSLRDRPPIQDTARITVNRFGGWLQFIAQFPLQHLISNPQVRSLTVLPFQGTPNQISQIKTNAKAGGFLLGDGYGDLKASTFRIANFPAIKESEIEALKRLLSDMHL